jgi:MFS family permease
MSLSIRAVPNEQRATAMGLFQATYSIGMIIGPWLAGWLAEVRDLSSIFVVAAVVALVALVIVAAAVPNR